jgi:hypothetical protein
MKRVGWYTRDGHTDFFARCSVRLAERGNRIESFYVCHTALERDHLHAAYGLNAAILSAYLNERVPSIVVSDERIRAIEDRYDFIPLRKLVWSEMHEHGLPEEKIIQSLFAYVDFWEAFLDRNHIDLMVSERPSTMSTSVLWALCNGRGIPMGEFINLGIDGRMIHTRSWVGDIDSFEEAYRTAPPPVQNAAGSDVARAYLESMTKKPEKPLFISQDLLTGRVIQDGELYQRLPRVGSPLRIPSKLARAARRSEFYLNEPLVSHVRDVALAHFRSIGHRLIDVFDRNLDPENERFFLFPLHHLHEWAVYPWAELQYPNVLDLIRVIASNLPLNSKLYVKEHTFFFPERSFGFYRELKRIPNVRLVDRREDAFSLIRKAEGLITLGGTMGWEAFLLGRPVFVLGVAWYRHLQGIYEVESHTRLAELLQNAPRCATASESEQLRAIQALYDISFEATRYPVTELVEADNIELYMPAFEAWIGGRRSHESGPGAPRRRKPVGVVADLST